MNTVLIIGFGKIGKYKAQIYRDLGYVVSIVDPAIDTINKETSFTEYTFYKDIAEVELKNFRIIDISTPTALHIELLDRLLQYFPSALYVVEKPLCSTRKDLERFELLVGSYPEATIVYSENYIFSSAISEISRLIVENNLDIKQVVIEFSKNRVPDISKGRFIDNELEGFGIEIPHILMIINRLGHKITSIDEVTTRDLQVNGSYLLDRQGEIEVKSTLDGNISCIFYQSMMGKTLFTRKYFHLPNNEKDRSNRYRILYLKCDNDSEIYVQFEPIEGKARFISKVTYVVKGSVVEEFEVEDNTLRYLLKHIDDVIQKRVTCNKYLLPQYAIRVTNTLLALKDLSITKDVPYLLPQNN